MHAFLPSDFTLLAYITGIIIILVFSGYLLPVIPSLRLKRFMGWGLAFGSAYGVHLLCLSEPAGFRMLAIITTLFTALKGIVLVEAIAAGMKKLSFIQWLAFATGWFGMRPHLFLDLGKKALPGSRKLWLFGISRVVFGLMLIFTAWWLIGHWVMPLIWLKVIITALLLIGISLTLHFGILNLSAAFWRHWGVDTRTLFKEPLLSKSLTEFWGKRWNLAFSEMTALIIYRPLVSVLGKSTATVAAFVFSGVLHEMAISVPVQKGWGLPLLYFAIHGILMLIERFLEKSGKPVYSITWIGRSWVIFWLVAPVYVLFHIHFLKGVVWSIINYYTP